eukprot:1304639-Heterocapsa_arctica.AAC.1
MVKAARVAIVAQESVLSGARQYWGTGVWNTAHSTECEAYFRASALAYGSNFGWGGPLTGPTSTGSEVKKSVLRVALTIILTCRVYSTFADSITTKRINILSYSRLYP